MRTMTELTESCSQHELPNGYYVPAKTTITFLQRVKDAWAVLIGKAEAVEWR